MIVMYGRGLTAFPGATNNGVIALVQTMQHAVDKHEAAGRPNSGDLS